MEGQKTLNNKHNIEEEGQSWRSDITQLQRLIKSNENGDKLVLAK